MLPATLDRARAGFIPDRIQKIADAECGRPPFSRFNPIVQK